MSNIENKTSIKDVIIVGGGLSGLTVAWELIKREQNFKVLILEAKDRLGGRTLTTTLKTSTGEDLWDIGGQWLASTHLNILQILQDLNLETFPQYTTGKKMLQLGDDSIKTYSGTIPNLSLPILLDLDHNLKKVNKLSKSLPLGDPTSHPNADYYDSVTVETINNNLTWTDSAFRIIKVAVEAIFGASPNQLSALFFLTYAASAGGFDRLIETDRGGAQELRVKGGTQQISSLMAERIGTENVHLSEPVMTINEMEDRVKVITKSGKEFSARKVVIAIPVHLNADIDFYPALSASKQLLHRNMPMGNLVKFVAVYEKAFWRENGFSGEILNEGCGVERFDPVNLVYDATSANGNPALVGFMSGQKGIVWTDVEPVHREQEVLKTLARFFGDDALSPVSYIEKNWYLEPYNGGCPSSLLGPGFMDHYAALKTPEGNFHWAGTETSSEWCGYMEGAVSSGKRAALEVLEVLRPDLLTLQEKTLLQCQPCGRRKSQYLREKHRVFRYILGGGIVAVGLVVLKKMYFRIAI